MTARGPKRAEFTAYRWIDNKDAEELAEEDDVPFSFTEETPPVTLRTEECDGRYAELAAKVNSLAARVAELERRKNNEVSPHFALRQLRDDLDELKRIVEMWTADS